jgi:hypothetical protein
VDEEWNNLTNTLSEDRQNDWIETDYLVKSRIKKSSKFYIYFKNILDTQMSLIAEEEQDLKDNIFFCPNLINFLLENYLPLFPLISLCFVPNLNIDDLPTSSSVENHWRNIKLYFKKIPLSERYVTVYFPMMLSYFNFRTQEYSLMKKRKSLFNRLSNKRKHIDKNIFYPNFESKRRRVEALECDYNEEDGYAKRKEKEKKTCKYVRRKIDFNTIEKRVFECKSGNKRVIQRSEVETERTAERIAGERSEKISLRTSEGKKVTQNEKKKMKQKSTLDNLSKVLGLPLKKLSQTPRKRKPPSCGLCRSVEHTKRTCPMLDA